MGVGTFSSDFHGTGGTFIVDGPLATETDYEAYKVEAGDDPMEYTEWMIQEDEDFNEDLVGALSELCRQLGMTLGKRRRLEASRAPFDSDFVAIGDNDIVAVGWRSWENDFIIGVGPDRAWLGYLDEGGAEAIREKARPVEALREEFGVLQQAIQDYVRLGLMERGYECRFKTSGYTSASYDKPDDIEKAKADLKVTIDAVSKSLEMNAEDALNVATEEQRIALAHAVLSDSSFDLKIEVVLYDHDDSSVTTYDPAAETFAAQMAVPEEFRGGMAALEVVEDGLSAVPRNEAFAPFFASLQARRRGDVLVLSVDEYVKAAGEPLVVEYNDGPQNFAVEFDGAAAGSTPKAG